MSRGSSLKNNFFITKLYAALFAVALTLASCSGKGGGDGLSSVDHLNCTVQSGPNKICYDYAGPISGTPRREIQDNCQASNGSHSTSTCEDTDKYKGCIYFDPFLEINTTAWIYSNIYETDLTNNCSAFSGTLVDP